MDAFFRKVSSTTLVAASDHDAELLKHIKTGDPTRLTFKRIRNYEFHKKFFALLDFAFDHWTPPDNYVGEKNFDQFRADVIILCGFYHQWIRLDGSTRTMPKSIAFGSMTEDEFEKAADGAANDRWRSLASCRPPHEARDPRAGLLRIYS